MFSVGYPVAERIIIQNADILTGYMDRGTYFKTILKGAYNNSEEAWEKAMFQAENLKEYSLLGDGEPFEIFINSKNLDHYQWIVALTRIISAVFRKGGDVTFLVEELKAVFDPRGGYWQAGGKFMPSIIAELGHVVEKHLIMIGMLTSQ